MHLLAKNKPRFRLQIIVFERLAGVVKTRRDIDRINNDKFDRLILANQFCRLVREIKRELQSLSFDTRVNKDAGRTYIIFNKTSLTH